MFFFSLYCECEQCFLISIQTETHHFKKSLFKNHLSCYASRIIHNLSLQILALSWPWVLLKLRLMIFVTSLVENSTVLSFVSLASEGRELLMRTREHCLEERKKWKVVFFFCIIGVFLLFKNTFNKDLYALEFLSVF